MIERVNTKSPAKLPSYLSGQGWPRQEIKAAIGAHGAAVIILLVLYLLFTWPLLRQPGSAILGTVVGDGWKVVEQFWWYKYALVDQGISPLHDSHIFFPHGWYTATSSHSLALMLPTIPFTMLLGPIGAYNLFMLFSFLLAGLGAYSLVYRLTQDRLAALFAAIAYAFSMSRMLRAAGHYNVSVGSAWVPWIFVCLEKARAGQTRRSQIIWFAAAGATYAASMLAYWYFVYLVAIPLAAYFLYDMWSARRCRERFQTTLLGFFTVFTTAGLLATPLALLTFQTRNQAGVLPFSFESTAYFAASLDRFIIPNRYHPLWGSWINAYFPDSGEQTFVYLGLAAVALAIVAMLRNVHRRTAAYTVFTLAALTMAMGPQLYWNAAPVTWSLPGTGRTFTIPLPGLLFFHYAPMFNVIRVWARFSLVASLGVAILSGLSLAHIRRQRAWGGVLSVLLVAFVALESFGQPFLVVPATVMNREVDQWLAAQPGLFGVMELPLNDRLNGSLMYSRTIHQKQLAGGYTAAIPGFFLEAVPHLATFPNQESIIILQRWGVRYLLYTIRDPVTFETDIMPELGRLSGASYVTRLTGYPGEHVYVFLIEEANQ
jgi:hypothetical protein